MAPDVQSYDRGQNEPSWHYGRVAIFAGLALGFGLWIVQLVLNYGLSEWACFPTTERHAHVVRGFGWVWPSIVGINLGALTLALFAAWLSWRNWRRTGSQDPSSFNDVLEKGEGPQKYLEVWGIATSLGFAAVIVFNTIVLFALPICAR